MQHQSAIVPRFSFLRLLFRVQASHLLRSPPELHRRSILSTKRKVSVLVDPLVSVQITSAHVPIVGKPRNLPSQHLALVAVRFEELMRRERAQSSSLEAVHSPC
jgi:hypothetical protein